MAYSAEQRASFERVKCCVSHLIEFEDLRRRAYQPINNLDCAMDQAVSDLCMDRFPPYHVLEERLRDAIVEAERLGLDEQTFIKRMRGLAFQGMHAA